MNKTIFHLYTNLNYSRVEIAADDDNSFCYKAIRTAFGFQI